MHKRLLPLLVLCILPCCFSMTGAWRTPSNSHHQHQRQCTSSRTRLLSTFVRGGGDEGGAIILAATLEQIETILAENIDKLVVIDFFSTNCPPCEKVAPLYQELSESEEFQDKVVFVKVNVDENIDAVNKFGVTGWPTFLFIKNGEVQTEIVGGNLAEATLYDWVKLLMPKESTTATKEEKE